MRFLCCNWDEKFPVWDWFTAFFYDVNKTNSVMTQSLLRYVQTQIEAAEKGSYAAQQEVERCEKIMREFVEKYAYVMIAYCIYCEGD